MPSFKRGWKGLANHLVLVTDVDKPFCGRPIASSGVSLDSLLR